jgi:hypothetical protein
MALSETAISAAQLLAAPICRIGSGCGGFFAISRAPRQLRDRNAVFSEKAETIPQMEAEIRGWIRHFRSLGVELT